MSYLLDVPPPRPLPPAVRDAQCRLVEDIVRRRRPFWRSRFAVLCAAVVLTGGGVATALRLKPDHVTDKRMARCYSSAVREDGRDFPGTSVQVGTPTRPGDRAAPPAGLVEDALSLCSLLWRDGQLLIGKAGVQDPTPDLPHAIPPLTECVLPDGSAAVFPGDSQTCERLGLPPVRT